MDRAGRLPEARASGRCCGRSSGSARARCRWRFASCRRSAACSTGCARGRCACRPGPTGSRCTAGSRRTAARRRPLRRGPRRRALPADRRRRAGRRARGRPPRARRDRRPARPLGTARPARQGLVPRRAPGDLRPVARGLAVRDREPDRRLAARLHLHLVGRGVLEAQPPLPLRDRGDGLEHALEPLAEDEGEAVRELSGRPAAVALRGARRASGNRGRVRPAARAAALQRRHDRDPGGDRDAALPHPHHLDLRARRAARVEPVHDLRAAVPVRPLRRRAALDPRRPAGIGLDRGRRGRVCRCSATCVPRRSRSCPRCATTPATGRRAPGCSARRPAPSGARRRVEKVAPMPVEQVAQLYDRETGRVPDGERSRLPRDAQPRARAHRPARRARPTRSTTTTCARAS